MEEEQSARAALIARARRDESVPVRVAATEALGAFDGPEIVGILEEISVDDPDQNVRYAAELLLLDLRTSAGSRKSTRVGSD
jgi:HEAT repeat protein